MWRFLSFAWTSFTWFASGYDPDDWFYRISVMFQMFGSLMIAAKRVCDRFGRDSVTI
ncbi:MAG: low temperature requirement protein A [Psychrobacter celer]